MKLEGYIVSEVRTGVLVAACTRCRHRIGGTKEAVEQAAHEHDKWHKEKTVTYKHKQCEAITVKGFRCKSGAQAGKDYCGPHSHLQERQCTVEGCKNDATLDEVLCWIHLDQANAELETNMEVVTAEPEVETTFTYTYEGVTYVYITITGHRPNKLGGYNPKAELNVKVKEALRTKMLNAVTKFGNVVFRIGMAIGADQMAAEICVEENLVFDAYTPCHGQEKPWPKAAQEHYHELLTHARETYVTHDGPYPGAWVLQKRNEQMIDGADGVQADYLLSVYDGTPGGTANCVRYARSKGVKEVNINPRRL